MPEHLLSYHPPAVCRDARECYYNGDLLVTAVAVVLAGGPCLALVRKLLKVHDSFKISEELFGAIGGNAILGGEENHS